MCSPVRQGTSPLPLNGENWEFPLIQYTYEVLEHQAVYAPSCFRNRVSLHENEDSIRSGTKAKIPYQCFETTYLSRNDIKTTARSAWLAHGQIDLRRFSLQTIQLTATLTESTAYSNVSPQAGRDTRISVASFWGGCKLSKRIISRKWQKS
jgi:hypothetical protein